MSLPVIELTNISFGYNSKPILDDVSLVVERGDFVGVVGSNGTGKSTLIRLALGLLSPARGEIQLLGQNITRFREWHRIGYMAQKVASFNTGFPATVREIVETHLRTQKSPHGTLSRRAIKTRVEQALDLTGMREAGNSLIGELSGGQQQRVFLARVLAGDPEVMFLDEPLVGIDAASQQLFCSILDDYNRERGLTILMVTHDPAHIVDRINRLACLEQGKLFLHESPEEIRQELAQSTVTHHHPIYHHHSLG
jgi:zinc transport system ATP-binding protein